MDWEFHILALRIFFTVSDVFVVSMKKRWREVSLGGRQATEPLIEEKRGRYYK